MKRIIASVAVAAGVTIGTASTVGAQSPGERPAAPPAPVAAHAVAQADPFDIPPIYIGMCIVRSGGGWLGGPCPPGHRPYIGAIELSGPDRAETAVTLANAHTAGAFQPGTVFLARWEDLSATVMAATLSGGSWVMLPGGDGPLPGATLAELRALAPADTVVIVGGDGAIGVSQRVEAMRALKGWG